MAKYIVPFNTRLEQAIYDELVAVCEPDDEERGLKRVYVVNQALREWLARRRMELRRRGKPSKKPRR